MASFPTDKARVDTWIRDGAEIPPLYDSLLAKVVVSGKTREATRRGLAAALSETVVHGVETNRQYLGDALGNADFVAGRHDTTTLGTLSYRPSTVQVVAGGTHTTVQSYPGRLGYWAVGVPPSGPMDDVSFRLGNRLLGNREGATGLEITLQGPTLAFGTDAAVLVAGVCEVERVRDGAAVPLASWQVIPVVAGDELRIGRVTDGQRAYLLLAGGLDVPKVMGSAATFTLGGIGGMNGRELAPGDVLRIAPTPPVATVVAAPTTVPTPTARHVLRVTMGPHSTEDFLTPSDIREFLGADWTVHYHSNRTGVRLVGPRPSWARPDGGDAGLHPSNVHDNAYAFGTIDFTGDMPVILGPDGPSLGGFVCPATVIEADRWKLGQLIAGDRVRLSAVTEAEARRLGRLQDDAIARGDVSVLASRASLRRHADPALVSELEDIRIRRAAQDALLVEFGPNVLDIELRLRVHALEAGIAEARIDGIVEMTPGIRSLLVRFDWRRFAAADIVARLDPLLNDALCVPASRIASRIVHLPLSWDDPACRQAVDRYMRAVRADAPWCPDNIEFVRRINGLPDRQAVKDIVFDADYLVMGLGDVYLGAPVATPLDPRHRLVTTKYNPARTWTAENSVGIGGAYLCIYGMEGPGGYQFVGRTLQVWNRHRRGRAFDEHWLLRPFDRIRFHEVDARQLAEMREAFPRGALDIDIEPGVFDHEGHQAFLDANRAEIEDFERCRRRAFARELDDWRARGLMTLDHAVDDIASRGDAEANGDPGVVFVASPLAGSIWSVAAKPGQKVRAGDVLFVVESMKAEFEVKADQSGVIADVLVRKGQLVRAGEPLATTA